MQVTLGGDRLGSGKKMKVDLENYGRSTHDLSYIMRTTASAGTLIPFMKFIAVPGDTWDIDLECDVKTLPTVGPLFGSFKVQLDVFQVAFRLYQTEILINKSKVGMNMASVKLPVMRLTATPIPENVNDENQPGIDICQINQSCVLAYLGVRGIGNPNNPEAQTRDYMAGFLLALWDIYFAYYANQQEEIGAVIHTPEVEVIEVITSIEIESNLVSDDPLAPSNTGLGFLSQQITIIYTGGIAPDLSTILFYCTFGQTFSLQQIAGDIEYDGTDTIRIWYNYSVYGNKTVKYWGYIAATDTPDRSPQVFTFPLENINTMRANVMAATHGTAYVINQGGLPPYDTLLNPIPGTPTRTPYVNSQEGLPVKTYQADILQNWLNSEWIDGPGGINELTAIDTSSGEFTIDSFIIAKKIYMVLNRIAVSGGTYDDWINVNWTQNRWTNVTGPVYHGGLVRELVFQEVVNNSESQGENGTQVLGTLAGKGIMSGKRKGGQVTIKCDEPSMIMGLFSLTPRIDYSQGNDWDIELTTLDDLHKPGYDQIGFEDLPQTRAAWWADTYNGLGGWTKRYIGKIPAWTNYTTNYNRTYGNFAMKNKEMFMTLNRRYEAEYDSVNGRWDIKDLTTYIDPSKYNFIFAEQQLDAMNFWVQIGVDAYARRVMSAKAMPTL